MEDIVLEQLEELRGQYQNGHVSVMVGAGFSKNACPEFPSWNELLYDMVTGMYQGEIEAAYLRYLKLNPSGKMSLDVFKIEEANRIIYRRGPLNLVSDYIARKGFRESIEHYIEERIPYIDKANNEFRYGGKNEKKRIKINPDNFSAHVKLIQGQRWVKRYTTNYDRLLEYAANSIQGTLTPITKAKNLSVFRNDPTLIKLHGDLYHPGEPRDFRFDGNPHQQYIISAEDYKTYPKDHEAFTQLMRISLLQGVFCLIGFSGDDPNFVNWIEWVRDILEREESTREDEKEKDYKIYLIGLSRDMPGLDKQLFYENHNIFYIPILRDDVKEKIGASPTDEIRDVFCCFFDYLEKDNYPQVGNDDVEITPQPITSSETTDFSQNNNGSDIDAKGEPVGGVKAENRRILAQSEKKEYQLLWNSVYESKIEGGIPDFTQTLIIDEEKVNRLRQIKVWNRIVSNSDQQKYYLSHIHNNKKLTISEAQLAILALKDTGILIDNNLIKIISESGIGKDDIQELNQLVDRAKTLCSDWTDDDKPTNNLYELILISLYNLDFASARALLKIWEPTGNGVLKKAMLLYFFMEEGAKELILDYLKHEGNAKERFYATRLLNLIEGVFPQKYSLDIFENANIQDYAEVMSNYIKRVNNNKEKIVRYGDGKNEKIIYLDGSKPNKHAEAMAVLNFLVEAPSMPSFRNFFVNISAENWYSVHNNLFERFPYPILFYDLMCLDKKVRSRIGQDYAYSDHLKDTCLDKILENMLKAFLSDDTPYYLKESILSISKELFVSVPSVKWEGLFMQIWEKDVLEWRFNNKEDRRNDVLDSFLFKGLNSLKNKAARQHVIADVLRHAKKDTGFAINCLYYLHVIKTDGKNAELANVVKEFISQIVKPEELTMAGNIYRILTDEQIGQVADICIDLLNSTKGKSIDKVVYQSAQFFVKDDPVKRKVYIESVCNSPLLWKSGVTTEGHYTSFTYLNITNFMRRIYIDKDSLFIIYSRLRESLNNLIEFGVKHKSLPVLGDLDGLLSEMLSFLNYYRDRLREFRDYDEIYVKAQNTLREVSGVKDTEDGLLSPYEEEVRDAMSFIYTNRDTLTRKDIAHYVNIIINRLLLRNSDGLDSCIAYLRLFLNEGLIGKDDNTLMEGLDGVLNRYDKDTAQDCNMNLVMTTRDMSRIGKMLKKFGYSSKGIDYWIKLHTSGRFMSNFS